MLNKNTILLVEDEQELAVSIVAFLEQNDYACTHASNLKKAKEYIAKQDFNAVLLDLGLPDGNGMDLIQQVKNKDQSIGVIILSAKDALDKKVQGLELGADDYLTKPFFMPELNARLKSLIRRLNFDANNELIVGGLNLFPEQMRLLVKGKEVTLTAKEFNLLLYFVSNKERVLSKTVLGEYMSSNYNDYGFSDDMVYTHIKNLKKKLEKKGCPDYIKNVYGVGYKFSLA